MDAGVASTDAVVAMDAETVDIDAGEHTDATDVEAADARAPGRSGRAARARDGDPPISTFSSASAAGRHMANLTVPADTFDARRALRSHRQSATKLGSFCRK